MRVLQLIDTLEAGGAERMAVSLANALCGKVELSALCATRSEGPLRGTVSSDVLFFTMKKMSAFDRAALMRLAGFIRENRIGIVHAHGTSVFTAVLVKRLVPGLRVIWHEHYGARAQQSRWKNLPLWAACRFVDAAIGVNPDLAGWIGRQLGVPHTVFIPNFATLADRGESITLRGNGRKIVVLANLKPPKNHHRLVSAFASSGLADQGWTLHLGGKDFVDAYSESLKAAVAAASLSDCVFLYGSIENAAAFLEQGDLAVLASTSEGFPVALLEYGLAGLPVVCTQVGYCREIVGGRGWLFDPENEISMARALSQAAADSDQAAAHARELSRYVRDHFVQGAVIDQIMKQYARLTD